LEVNWDDYEMFTLAGLLKAWARELKEPLIPPKTYVNLMELSMMEGEHAISHFIKSNFLSEMDDRSRQVLQDIISLLKDISAYAHINSMNVDALAMVWAPNLIRVQDPKEEMQLNKPSRKFVEFLIDYHDSIF
jgi:hypothetical protein